MADALGRLLLEAGGRPDWWPSDKPLQVIISEGEPDFLSWATHYSDADAAAPAVLGIVGGGRSGSWSADIAARVPDDSLVCVRTDPDVAGEQYADAIAHSLSGRCRVLRRVRRL